MLRVKLEAEEMYPQEMQRRRFISFCSRHLTELLHIFSGFSSRTDQAKCIMESMREEMSEELRDYLYVRWTSNETHTCPKETLFTTGDALPKPLTFASFSRYASGGTLPWTTAADPAAARRASEHEEPDHDEGEDE